MGNGVGEVEDYLGFYLDYHFDDGLSQIHFFVSEINAGIFFCICFLDDPSLCEGLFKVLSRRNYRCIVKI